eukprot:jgi/Picsp_1/5036/NSC_02399-R1_---NA---
MLSYLIEIWKILFFWLSKTIAKSKKERERENVFITAFKDGKGFEEPLMLTRYDFELLPNYENEASGMMRTITTDLF